MGVRGPSEADVRRAAEAVERVATLRTRAVPEDATLVKALQARAERAARLDDEWQTTEAHEDWYRTAVRVHGEAHVTALRARRLVARVYAAQGRHLDALELWEPMVERGSPLAHRVHIDEVLSDLVDTYLALGRPQDAHDAGYRLLNEDDAPMRRRYRMRFDDVDRAYFLAKVGRFDDAATLLYALAREWSDDGYRCRSMFAQVQAWDDEHRARTRVRNEDAAATASAAAGDGD